MVGSINKVIICGRVANDPTVKQFPDNTKCNFSVATNRSYTRRDGTVVNQADFHRVVTSGSDARIAEKQVVKGTPVGVEGRLTTRSYLDATGNKRYITEIIAENLFLLGRANTLQETTQIPHANQMEQTGPTNADGGFLQNASTKPANASPNPAEDDLPF
ncbi:MAG: single-stranded DNA-binding protein [Cytophagales bacterium]